MSIPSPSHALLVLGLALSACTATSTVAGGDPAPPIDVGQPGPPTQPSDASTTTPPPSTPATPQGAQIRFANAAYQTGSVDFCVKRQGASSWEGPLLTKLGVEDGAEQGAMTNAFDREAGAWEVGTVSAKATSCDKPFATSKLAVVLPPSGSVLVVLIGNGGATGSEGHALVGLLDERTGPAPSKTRVRFLHASPNWLSERASVYVGGDSTPTFEVAFGQLATSSPAAPISAAGYIDVIPAYQIDVRGLVDFDGNERQVHAPFTAKAGTRATLIFDGAAGSAFYPPRVRSCPDDLKTATALDPFVACR